MLGSVVFPVIILAILILAGYAKDKEESGVMTAWYLIVTAGILSGICTSLGAAFSAALTAVGCLILAIWKRKPGLFVKGLIACIPQAVYMAAYVLLK